MSRNDLKLSVACGDHALTQPIQTGEVSPERIDWEVSTIFAPKRHWRMLRGKEFDVCELSLGSYLASRSAQEDYPFTAIPVFPHRSFRHSNMFKHSGAGVSTPDDLEGKKVGLNTWQTTAGIWMRGIAKEKYGLDLEDVTWYRRAPEDVPLGSLERFDIRDIPENKDLEEMLCKGQLKGAFYPALFDSVIEGKCCERLFENPFEEELNYYEETGIFPLMHTVVIRNEILEEAPWAAGNIYKAFKRSKDLGLKRLEDPRTSALVWARKYLEEEKSIFSENPWSYGLTEWNLKALDTLLKYCLDQELIPYKYKPEELFVKSLLGKSQ
ncbi:MAG: ABC transporter substrate-binding protein [Candidatus Bipolaricaulia bacterium]